MSNNFYLLANDAESMTRFCELMERHATCCGLESEIADFLEDIRMLRRNGGLGNFIDKCVERQLAVLALSASAIGRERGKRLANLFPVLDGSLPDGTGIQRSGR